MLHDRLRNAGSPLGFAAVTLAALLLSPAAWSGGSGRCISTSVPDTMVLPDGSVHPAGQLRICYTRAFSPVAGLHETYVNGQPVGRFVSRTGQGEAGSEAEGPFFVFSRNTRGALVLEGYADPVGNRLNTYLIQSPGRGVYDVVSHWRMSRVMQIAGDRQHETVILLAAARN